MIEAKTLADVWQTFLGAKQEGRSALNSQRGKSDLGSYERTLLTIAAGVAGRPTELAAVSAGIMSSPETVVNNRLEKGVEMLSKGAPSSKTVANLKSCMRALRRTYLGACGQSIVGQSPNVKRKQNRKKLSRRPAFTFGEMPEGLRKETEDYIIWKTASVLTPAQGSELRGKRARPVTARKHVADINGYVGHLVRERKMDSLCLAEVCDPENFVPYANQYTDDIASGRYTGGYAKIANCAVALASISKFVATRVAKGENT